MKTSIEFPPNYEMIKLVFPHLEAHRPIFCYGDTIFNPFDVFIRGDLEAHEKIHSIQQGDDPNAWWLKYLSDLHFRLSQEIEAYGGQYAFAKDKLPPKVLEMFKEDLAKSLSGELYGNLLSFGEAISKIRNYAKNI